MSRPGLVESGTGSGNYRRETAKQLLLHDRTCRLQCQGNYSTPERLKSRKGIVKEVGETSRGYYVLAEFDE